MTKDLVGAACESQVQIEDLICNSFPDSLHRDATVM